MEKLMQANEARKKSEENLKIRMESYEIPEDIINAINSEIAIGNDYTLGQLIGLDYNPLKAKLNALGYKVEKINTKVGEAIKISW